MLSAFCEKLNRKFVILLQSGGKTSIRHSETTRCSRTLTNTHQECNTLVDYNTEFGLVTYTGNKTANLLNYRFRTVVINDTIG